MRLATRKPRCPACGAPNAADARRCGSCTRPVDTPDGLGAALYREALWAEPISRPRSWRPGPRLVVAAALGAAALANWFWLRVGPDWAHAPHEIVAASDWRTYRGEPGLRVDLPGEPMRSVATGPTGPMSTSTVWVDRNWLLARDGRTRSAAALASARTARHATLVAASGPAPTAPSADVATLAVGVLVPGAELSGIEVVAGAEPRGGARFDVRARYRGHPEVADSGEVRARVVVVDGRLLVVAAFARGGGDDALFGELVADFVPEAD